jgi:hypothetical protein
MIPAILSCVYVIYLYHTLNQPTEPKSTTSSASSLTNEPVDALLTRLNSLQVKLDQLVIDSKSGGHS